MTINGIHMDTVHSRTCCNHTPSEKLVCSPRAISIMRLQSERQNLHKALCGSNSVTPGIEYKCK